MPERLTLAWWSTRPVWWAAVGVITGVFVVATAVARARRPGRTGSPGSGGLAAAGVAIGAVAAAYVGLEGPASAPRAVLASAGFVTA